MFPSFLFVFCVSWYTVAGQLLGREHRTQAAAEKSNNLSCYHCGTLDEGERCAELPPNMSETTHESFTRKCPDDMRMCMVKRFSYTTSTENTTSIPRMWSLERNCSNRCEAGCIVIGERTKLYACTACCDTPYCNTGKGGTSHILPSIDILVTLLLLLGPSNCHEI